MDGCYVVINYVTPHRPTQRKMFLQIWLDHQSSKFTTHLNIGGCLFSGFRRKQIWNIEELEYRFRYSSTKKLNKYWTPERDSRICPVRRIRPKLTTTIKYSFKRSTRYIISLSYFQHLNCFGWAYENIQLEGQVLFHTFL